MYKTFLASLLLLTGCVASAAFREPLPDAASRATPLYFGLQVMPDAAHNPIDPPERFEGYHVGTDFEVAQEELETDVPVFAICSGEIIYSGFAEGYGGLIVQHCSLNGEAVTVLYGHLLVVSLAENKTSVGAGTQIALLAPPRSGDSDGNRKHLHLGIHRGTEPDYRGYVQTKEELDGFIDPFTVLPPQRAGTEGAIVPYWKQ